jgi:hypothetical protein
VPNYVTQQVAQTAMVPEQTVHKVPVTVTAMQPEVQVRQVPVQVTRMEQYEEVQQVPVTVQRPVVEQVPNVVSVQVCKWVPQEVVRKIPVTTYKYLEEERVEQIPIRTCKMVPETRVVQSPRTVHRWVQETTMREVPKRVIVRVPINGCGVTYGTTTIGTTTMLPVQSSTVVESPVQIETKKEPVPADPSTKKATEGADDAATGDNGGIQLGQPPVIEAEEASAARVPLGELTLFGPVNQ